MNDSKSGSSVDLLKLITMPAMITLAVTILRLVGELSGWSSVLFSTKAGGGLAVVGISWLPLIFGPYFAAKLPPSARPTSAGKAIGFAVLALVIYIGGGMAFGIMESKGGLNPVGVIFLFVMLAAAFVFRFGWLSLETVLLSYALAARIPVILVYYIAMAGNGGRGLGTHYDKVPPALAAEPVIQRWFMAGLLPQATLWIGWTVVIGGLAGSIWYAIWGSKTAAPVAQPTS